MSLDKAIRHGKERRKPYYRSKSIDRTCRNHGSCPYCANGRMHKHKRLEPLPDHTTRAGQAPAFLCVPFLNGEPTECFMVFHDVQKALAGRNLQGLLYFRLHHGVSGYPAPLVALLSAYPQRQPKVAAKAGCARLRHNAGHS